MVNDSVELNSGLGFTVGLSFLGSELGRLLRVPYLIIL